MSYNFILTYGFFLSKKEISEKFSYLEEGKFHFEKRFDPKTGYEVTPEKIWEIPEKQYFYFENKKLDIQDYQIYNKYSGYLKNTFRAPEFAFGQEYEITAKNDFELLCWLIANKKEENRKNFTFKVAFDALSDQKVCFFLPLDNNEETCYDYEHFGNDSISISGRGKISLEELREKETSISELQNNLKSFGFTIEKPELFIRLETE